MAVSSLKMVVPAAVAMETSAAATETAAGPGCPLLPLRTDSRICVQSTVACC